MWKCIEDALCSLMWCMLNVKDLWCLWCLHSGNCWEFGGVPLTAAWPEDPLRMGIKICWASVCQATELSYLLSDNLRPKKFSSLAQGPTAREGQSQSSAVWVGGMAGDNHGARTQWQKIQVHSWEPTVSQALAQTPWKRMQETVGFSFKKLN